MTDVGTSLVGMTIERLAVFSALQAFGQQVLYVALLVWLLYETRQLLLHGRCDYLTPVVRVAVGWVLLEGLPTIGTVAERGVLHFTRDVLGAANHEQWIATMNHVLSGSLRISLVDVLTLFSLRAILVFGSSLLYLLMGIVKLLVIDVLWPLVFGVVLIFGTLAIPLGTLPGVGALTGWLRNLVEVALWPVVFQTLVALQVATFGGLLEQVRHLDLVSVFTSFPPQSASDHASGVAGHLGLLMQFWALCCAYTLMTLLTPLLSSWVVRSPPISAFGQVVAIRMAQVATHGASLVTRTSLGATVAFGAARRMGGAHAATTPNVGPGPSGHGRAGASGATAAVTSGARDDQRQYPPSTPVSPGDDRTGAR